MNNYEGVFILRATLDKDAQEKLIEEIKAVIKKNKGEIVEFQNWGKKRLTFQIKKQQEGVYCFSDFRVAPDLVKKVEQVLKLNDSILRIMVVRKES